MTHVDPYAEIQRLIAMLPQSTSAVLARARVFQREGEVEFAIELLKRAREREPNEMLRLALGRIFLEIERPRDAMAELVAVLKEDSNHVEALLTLAEALVHIDEKDRATKMLDRAKELGAPAQRIASVTALLRGSNSDAIPFAPKGNPQPRRTLLGLPHTDNGEYRPLPSIESGSFNALDAYDYGASTSNEMSLLQDVPNLHRDHEFDSMLSNAGVPVRHQPEPIYRSEPSVRLTDDIAGPSDQTQAVVLQDSPYAKDFDSTHALILDDDEFAGDLDATGYLPRQEDMTEEEIPGAPVFFDEDSFVRDHVAEVPHHHHVDPRVVPSFQEQQVAFQSAAPVPHHQRSPSDSSLLHQAAPSLQPQFQPSQPAPIPTAVASAPSSARPSGWSSDQFPQYQEAPSAIPRADAPPTLGSIGLGMKLIALVAVLLLGSVLALVISGTMEATQVEKLVKAAAPLEESSEYEDQKKALKLLDQAVETRGFLRVALPGTKGPKLREDASARQAFVAGLLNFEHAEPLTPDLATRIRRAPSESGYTAAAEVLSLLSKGLAFDAAELASEKRKAFPGHLAVEEVDVLARLALGQPRSAHIAVAPIRSKEAPGLRHQTLLFRVDSQNQSEKSIPAIEGFLKANPGNIRATLALAKLLKPIKDRRPEAERILSSILESEARSRASSADLSQVSLLLGDVLVLIGDMDRAEEKYREAIREVPNLAQSYAPLLDFYLTQGRFDEIPAYLKRAKENGADGPELSFVEANYLLRTGKTEECAHFIMQSKTQDLRKFWWLGMAYLDLGRFADAAIAFEQASSGPLGVSVAKALAVGLKAIGNPDTVDKALKEIDEIGAKHEDDPTPPYAKAVLLLENSRTASREGQDKALKESAALFQKAFELDPTGERYTFGECEAHLMRLDERSSERSCLAGRKINPHFTPGTILTARLRRLQDQLKESRELIDAASKQRPNDVGVAIERIRILMQSRDVVAAQDEINRWHSREANHHGLRVLEGRLAYLRGDYQRAAAYLEKAHTEEPNDGEAAVFYSAALARLGRYDQAGETLRDMLSHPEWGPYGWMFLGEVRRLQGRWSDVNQNLNTAKREISRNLGPRARTSLLQTQYALYFANRFDWNRPQVERNLLIGKSEGDPDEPELNLAFATLYSKQKKPDYEAALMYLEHVLRVAPYRCDAIQMALTFGNRVSETRRREIQAMHKSSCDG